MALFGSNKKKTSNGGWSFNAVQQERQKQEKKEKKKEKNEKPSKKGPTNYGPTRIKR